MPMKTIFFFLPASIVKILKAINNSMTSTDQLSSVIITWTAEKDFNKRLKKISYPEQWLGKPIIKGSSLFPLLYFEFSNRNEKVDYKYLKRHKIKCDCSRCFGKKKCLELSSDQCHFLNPADRSVLKAGSIFQIPCLLHPCRSM